MVPPRALSPFRRAAGPIHSKRTVGGAHSPSASGESDAGRGAPPAILGSQSKWLPQHKRSSRRRELEHLSSG